MNNFFVKQLYTGLHNFIHEVLISVKEQPVTLLYTILFSSFFSISFYVNDDIKNGLIEGKLFYFVLIAVVFLCVYGLRLLKESSHVIHITLTDIFVVAFLLYVLLHILLKNHEDLKSNNFIGLLMMTMVYWAGKILIKESNQIYPGLLLLFFLGFGCCHAVYGLYQLYGFEPSYHRSYQVTGSFFNPAPLGGYLASILPVGLAIFLFQKGMSPWNSLMMYFGLATVLAIVLIIPSTQSRASWIALLAGSSFIFAKYYDIGLIYKRFLKSNTTRAFLLIQGIVTIIIIVIGLFYWKEDSANGRLLMWKVAIQIILNNPLTGVGFNQFTRTFGEQQAIYFKSGKGTQGEIMVAGKGEYAFNEYLHIGVEVGLVGLLIFMFVIFFGLKTVIVRHSRQYSNATPIAAAGGFISLLVFALFSYPFSMAPLLFNFYFFLSILSSFESQRIDIPFPRIVGCLFFFGLIIVCTWIIHNQYFKYKAMKEWQWASQLTSFSNHKEAIQIMEKIKPELMHRGDFMFEYGQTLTLNEEYQKGIHILEQAAQLTSDPYLFNSLGNCYQELKMYSEAERCYLHAWYLIPHKFYPRYLLVKMYVEKGDLEKAKALALEVKKMNIKIPSMAVNEILAEMDRILGIKKSE